MCRVHLLAPEVGLCFV